MQKGRALLVSGRLDQRSWEQDGQKRSKVEVVVEDFNFIGGGGGDGAGGGAAQSSGGSRPQQAQSKRQDDNQNADLGDEPINLDDIPF